jgi:CheY-like chemotaxis protein
MSKPVRVLVLDDNIDVAQGVAEILELSGYQVTLVHDALSAVDAYCGGNVDMGLFDVRMPGMNGVEAFHEIRRRRPDASILLMSGFADDDLVSSALTNGALGLLSKPFEPDEMLARLLEVQPAELALAN